MPDEYDDIIDAGLGKSRVDPRLQGHLDQLLPELQRHGLRARVAETYRSPQKQNAYYAQGRTRPGPIVTYARGTQGRHTLGRAADIDLLDENDRPLANNDPRWGTFGEIAKSRGLKWGGDFPKLKDFRHVELTDTQQQPVNTDYDDIIQAAISKKQSQPPSSSVNRAVQSATSPATGTAAPSIKTPFGARVATTTRRTQQPSQRPRNPLMERFAQQRTIDQSQRERELQARQQATEELKSRRGAYGAPTLRGALHVISNPVDALTGLFKSDEQLVSEMAAENLKQQDVMATPEVTDIRKEYGRMGAPVRTVVAPLARGGAGLLRVGSGIASAFGIAPNQLSDWATKRAEIIEAGASAAPLAEERGLGSLVTGEPELKEIERGIPEKIITGVADLGVGLGSIILLKKATNLPFNQLLALEAAAKASDKPVSEQAAKAAEGFALGTALESHLGRAANAALFGAPTAAQTGYEVSQGRMSPLDAAIQTGIQAGAGAVLTPRRRPSAAEARLSELQSTTPSRGEVSTEPNPLRDFRRRVGREPQVESGTAPTAEVTTPQRGTTSAAERSQPETPTKILNRIEQLPEAEYKKYDEALRSDPVYREAEAAYFDAPKGEALRQALVRKQQAEIDFAGRYFGGVNEPQTKVQPPVEAQRAEVESAGDIARVGSIEQAVRQAIPEASQETSAANSADATTVSPARFYHRDYGEVTEAPSQRKAGRNRVKVIDAEGGEHYVKRSDLSGRGNQRMVPLKPEPAPEPPKRVGEAVDVDSASSAASLPTVTESVTKTRESTSIKNAATDELRADLQLNDIAPPERRAWQTSIDNAQRRGLDKQAEQIADKVIKGNREVALDLEESAALLIKTRELENQWEEIYRSNPADPRLSEIKAQLDKVSAAADLGGTETARTLSFRRASVDKSFRLISLIRQAEKAKGRSVTEVEVERYAQLVKERDTAIEQRDIAREQLYKQSLQKEIDRIARTQQRTQSRQSLDDEFASLKTEFSQALAETKRVQSSGLAGLDPEGKLTKTLVKMARNRVRAGVNSAEQLIDELHAVVEGRFSKRQIAEAVSGYGVIPKSQPEDIRRLNQIRSEIKTLLRQQDITEGTLTAKQQGPKRDYQRNKQRLEQLRKREAEYERRVSERDFEPRIKEPYPYSPDVRAAERRVEIAEAKFYKEMKRAEGGHQLRNLSGIYKAWLLSGPLTHVKNIAGTMGYQVFNEGARVPAVIADAALSTITKQRGISGPSPSAMLQAVNNAVRVGGREAVDIMRYGATKEQMERHQYQEIDFGVNTGKSAVDKGVKVIELAHNAIFRFMSASDRVSYQFALKRNLVDRASIQARNEGLDGSARRAREKELVENPPEQLLADAKHDALVSTFNNNNALSTKIKAARAATIKNPNLSRKAAQRINAAENLALDLVLPFDRTPTNVVMRILEASPAGYVKNAGQLVKAAINKGMSAEDQRQFSQTFGRATAGTALIALGWKLADELFDVDDKGIVSLKLGKRTIRLDYTSPLGNLIATGVRLKKAHNEQKGATEDAKIIGREVSNIPVLRATSGLSELMQDPARSGSKTAARFAFGAVPFSGAVRFAGDVLDPKERDAKGFTQQFQRNVPIWRESLPEHVDRRRQRVELGEDVRLGRKSAAELEEMVREGKLSEARKKQILRDAKVSAKQARFNDYLPSTALDRYERMDAAGREEVREQMEKKAYNLVHSDTLTEEQKAEFQRRLDALGIVPQAPKKSSSSSFKDLFKQSSAPF